MNFFEHQARARASSRRLVLLFALAVAAIVLAITGVALILLAAAQELPHDQVLAAHADLLVLVALGTLALIFFASLFKSMSLRSGGGSVARSLGGVPVPPDTRNPRLRRLRNVVEEIAIASGVPVPEIYVLEQENGINAFAAGWSPADAAVAVTRGTLEKLSRDELQGVIAHEFSHVVNGDMRLNIRLMGLLFGILVIAVIGREVFEATSRSRGSSRKGGGGAIVLAALAVMLIGYIGLFFGRLIKAGVSRSREYLADSSAVQFTRQTAGIAGALKKIAGLDAGSKLLAGKGEEVSHMLFGDGVGYSRLFATHPPLLERIRKLEPRFDAAQLAAQRALWNAPGYVADDAAAGSPVSLLAAAGQPADADYRHAEALHAAIAPAVLAAAADESRAIPLLLGLLLDPQSELRALQLALLEKRLGAAAARAALAEHGLAQDLPKAQRLPLAALAFAGLRHQPRESLEKFLLAVNELIQADGAVCMFEFCLGNLLRVQVTDLLYPARAQVLGRDRLGQHREQALLLLSVLAQQGGADAARARQAFAAGVTHLFGPAAPRFEPPAQPAAALQATLSVLDRLDAPGKQLLVEAMLKTVQHDRRLSIGEAELLRAACGSLHCPLPPLLDTAG